MAYLTPSTAASFDVTLAADGSSSSVTIDGGSGANRFLVVGITYRNNNAHVIDAVTFNGDALTPFGAAVEATQCLHHMWYLANPDEGELSLVVDPDTGLGATGAVVSFMVFDDVDVSGTPFDGYTTANGTDTTADLTVTSESGDTPFFMYGVRASTPTGSAATNYTERYENVNGNLMGSGGEGTGAASVAFTGTVSSSGVTAWVAMGANLNAATGGTPTAALTGTLADGATEAQIVAGGQTLIITLTDDTWVASGATFDAQRQNIINGLDSAGSESAAWNAEVRDAIAVTTVVRTSDTIVTITLPALADYAVSSADETITCTVPSTAVTAAGAIVATPTFTITNSPSTTTTVWETGVFGPADATFLMTFHDVTMISAGSSVPASDLRLDRRRRMGWR